MIHRCGQAVDLWGTFRTIIVSGRRAGHHCHRWFFTVQPADPLAMLAQVREAKALARRKYQELSALEAEMETLYPALAVFVRPTKLHS